MAFINWNDSLNLGIVEVDAQHQHLISLINELHDRVRGGGSRESVEGLLTEISDEIKAHFAAEERYFDRFLYPERESHRSIHSLLVRQIEELLEQTREGALPVTDSVLLFVKDWFLTHMTGSDLVYAVWMKHKGFVDPLTGRFPPEN